MLPATDLPVDVGGLTEEMKQDLEERIAEFEKEYEPFTKTGGEGYVKRIKKRDYIIALIVNGLIFLYWFIIVLTTPLP